jgi:nucleotide-binding universal stress UspA family protein
VTKTIIVGIDGSDYSLRAVEWATEEAARRGWALRLVYAVAPWPSSPVAFYDLAGMQWGP